MGLLSFVTGAVAFAASVSACSSEAEADDAGLVASDGGVEGAVFVRGESCASSSDCNDGYCNQGKCCASAAQACASACCGDGTVCLVDKCIVPGKACTRPGDCPDGQYCETALGAPAGPPSATSTCTVPPPASGKCVDRPTTCDANGAPAGCVPACEVHNAAGPLSVNLKWHWGPNLGPSEYPESIDVWSSPTVGRMHDANCDGKIDELDPPSIVFVSGNTTRSDDAGGACQTDLGDGNPTRCQMGVLRMIDGATGKTIWSLAHDPASPAGQGFAGTSTAIADIDGDGRMEIAVATGDGFIDIVDATGKILRRSDKPIEDVYDGALPEKSFGWGGGLAIADVDGDGAPEIAFGRTLFTTKGGKLTRSWVGDGGIGITRANALTVLADITDLDGGARGMELVAGRTAYKSDGGILWNRAKLLPDAGQIDGFSAVADFDKDGTPEVAVVTRGHLVLLDAKTGNTIAGPLMLATVDAGDEVDDLGLGGPPTIADFDGDGTPEIGVANSREYFVVRVDRSGGGAITGLSKLWSAANHDFSSSVTGSTVFDFEGDGHAEVVYADECFLWVWGSEAGQPTVRLALPTTSFTGTEASLVADVDGDGHADILLPSNRVNPGQQGWKCDVAPWNAPDPAKNRPAWTPPNGAFAWGGLRAYSDSANAWVGTRTLWNQHTYHVTNVCDPRDNACAAGATYGSIPKHETPPWTVPWLNAFRQNVLEKGIFDAPDAVVSLRLECTTPLAGRADVRNLGAKGLPAVVKFGIFAVGSTSPVAEVTTTNALAPGQTASLTFTAPNAAVSGQYVARILVDAAKPSFRECRADNNESTPVAAGCAR